MKYILSANKNMNKDEILIGCNGEYKVDMSLYRYVSGKHCKVVRKAGGIYIEDLNSTNGTYVNGVRISVKKVNAGDAIFLGGHNHYRLNLEDVLREIPLTDEEFRQKFLSLKPVYEGYTQKIERNEQKIQESSRLLTMLPMTLPGIIIGILPQLLVEDYHPNVKNIKLAVAITGGLFSLLGLFIGSKLSSRSLAKNKKEIKLLQESFREAYLCPNCARELGIQTSWDFWNRKGQCPYCNRKWRNT
jgi:hypothetical protein